MASESKSQQYMEKVPELRKKFLDKHYSSEKNVYDKRDISRVKTDDLFVLQFLNGRQGNVDKAHKIMIESLKWRKSFGIHDLSETDIPEDILKSGVFYMHGKDKSGASLVIVTLKHFAWKGDKEKCVAYTKMVALTFEKHQREHPGEKLTFVNNSEGSGLANTDMDVSKLVINLMATCYPDTIENVLVLNYKKAFSALWKVIKALMDENLVKKYVFTKDGEIFQYIDQDQLSVELGGESTFVYKYPPEEKSTADSNSNVPSELVDTGV